MSKWANCMGEMNIAEILSDAAWIFCFVMQKMALFYYIVMLGNSNENYLKFNFKFHNIHIHMIRKNVDTLNIIQDHPVSLLYCTPLKWKSWFVKSSHLQENARETLC